MSRIVKLFYFQTGVYSNTVVLQHHSVVMTKADKIYKVKCTYDMSSKNITFGMVPIRWVTVHWHSNVQSSAQSKPPCKVFMRNDQTKGLRDDVPEEYQLRTQPFHRTFDLRQLILASNILSLTLCMLPHILSFSTYQHVFAMDASSGFLAGLNSKAFNE